MLIRTLKNGAITSTVIFINLVGISSIFTPFLIFNSKIRRCISSAEVSLNYIHNGTRGEYTIFPRCGILLANFLPTSVKYWLKVFAIFFGSHSISPLFFFNLYVFDFDLFSQWCRSLTSTSVLKDFENLAISLGKKFSSCFRNEGIKSISILFVVVHFGGITTSYNLCLINIAWSRPFERQGFLKRFRSELLTLSNVPFWFSVFLRKL